MADSDIVARLTLNARQFSTEFVNVIKKTAGDAKEAGKRAGKEFNTGLSEMLENPDINSGSFKFGFKAYNVVADTLGVVTRGALLAAPALAYAALQSEKWRVELENLGSRLKATGDDIGYTRDEVVSLAEEIGFATGRSRGDVLEAQKGLLDFDAVAGTVFRDVTELAADMASTFGRDLAGEAKTLGSTIQDLAEGDVDSLRKNFDFLDDAVLDNIETMVKAGDRYGAVSKLIAELKGRIGGAAEGGEGDGLSKLFNAFGISAVKAMDDIRKKYEELPIVAANIKYLTDQLERHARGGFGTPEEMGGDVLKLSREQNAARARLAKIDAEPVLYPETNARREDRRKVELDIIKEKQAAIDKIVAAGRKIVEDETERDRLARQAVENAEAEADARDKTTKSAARGRSEAERLNDAYDKQLLATERKLALLHAEREGNADLVTLAHEIADIEAQFAGKIAPEKLDRLRDITAEYAQQLRLAEEAAAAAERLDPGALVDFEGDLDTWKDAQKEIMAQEKRQMQQRERDFENLADVYERAFRDGSGSIWDQFKSMGKRAIAELLAAWTLGGTGGAGTLLGNLGGGGGGSGLGGILNLLGGGSGGGQSFNMIQSGQLPGGGTFSLPDLTGGGAGAGGLGGALSSVGPALGAFGLAVGVNQIVGDIFGFKGGPLGILTGPLKSILSPNRTSNAVLTGTGTPTTGGKGGKQDVALGLAGNVQDSLSQIADALGVDVGSFYTSIGVRGGDYRVNTGGSSLKIKNGAKNFGDDAEAAVEYAIRDAIGDGAFSGKISAAAERALRNTSKSIEDAIEDALTIESIPRRLREIEDPIGAAVDKVVEDFTKLRDTLVANGATAQQLADAEKLFNYEREAALERTESTLRDFLDSLKLGGNSPLSLRDQSATAEAAFAKYEADIAAGKAVDQAGFAEAAQAALDVKRQTDGSTQGYFDLYNRVVSAGNAAQGRIDSTGASRNDTNPFAKPTAEAAAETANNTSAANALLSQVNANLQALIAKFGGIIGGGFGNYGFVRGAI